MRLGEHLREEKVQEAAVVAQPIPPVVLRPALLGFELIFPLVDRAFGQCFSAALVARTNEDGCLDPLRVMT
jgi:uncharacterized protein YbjT (DUF2867 family)